MNIYTKGGDLGKTALPGAGRVAKDHPRVEAYGSLDEANACLGLSISFITEKSDADVKDILSKIQEDLFDCGSDLCQAKLKPENFKILEEPVKKLEGFIDHYMEKCPEISYFILPGGSPSSASIFQSSTVLRRAERRIVSLSKESEVNPYVIQYVNRLSDLLFVLARTLNHRNGHQETLYKKSGKVFS